MMIDSDEAIKRMQNVTEHYKKYGYMEEVMYRMAVGHCIDIVKEMAGKNNDVGRMYNILRKRVLRAKAKEQESKADIAVSD
jgi:plasmid replication initiation protein